jgi:hypothetical protein
MRGDKTKSREWDKCPASGFFVAVNDADERYCSVLYEVSFLECCVGSVLGDGSKSLS